ncbi:hypothetical protein PPSIR1_35887 [Plesiocystis pacifica SIR-1]|uniref:Lipoprotein n=1 Tax=Plesiocystis pacifica SIR-1 TaxID=391625 RepID=A6G1V6_9BACT|nr:hypothetical protein [Plesiocystis pacifica]EDM80146.1 hypothetical protein PPSIR1_35887 [Plesiocystis pacifica SIR-1]
MKKYLTASLALCFSLGALSGCTASEEDCVKLGDKFVELFMKDQPADNPLGEEILKSAAEAGKEEVIKQCKAEPPLKASIDCALKAETLDALEQC